MMLRQRKEKCCAGELGARLVAPQRWMMDGEARQPQGHLDGSACGVFVCVLLLCAFQNCRWHSATVYPRDCLPSSNECAPISGLSRWDHAISSMCLISTLST